jgi:hypothetical protein
MALKKCRDCGHSVSKRAEACPNCGAKFKTKSMGCGTLLLVILGTPVVLAVLVGGPSGQRPDYSAASSIPTPAPAPEREPEPDPKLIAMQNIDLKVSWSKGAFDTAMFIDATIHNGGKVNVKDIEITCQHYSNSGTNIDSNRKRIYEIVPAGKAKVFKHFAMGFMHNQATKSACEITDLAVM